MAAALFRARAEAGGLPVDVVSRGLLPGGAPAPREACEAVADYGVDIAGHQSAKLSWHDVRRSELVIGMTRRHVREIVVIERDAVRRTFTFREVVRRGEDLSPSAMDPRERIELLSRSRRRRELLGRAVKDDVADPFGGSASVYRATAAELDALSTRLVALLGWRDGPPSSGAGG
jgi:protein-tyrosine phosphatase